jgi:hypothetical protein
MGVTHIHSQPPALRERIDVFMGAKKGRESVPVQTQATLWRVWFPAAVGI